MDQPGSSSSSRRQGDEADDDRQEERRAAVAQMMAENSEGLGMKVINIIVQRYGVLPKELWDLNSISDMGAGRGIKYGKTTVPQATFERIISNNRYSIHNLTLDYDVSHEVKLPSSLLRLKIKAYEYTYLLDLPAALEELVFDPYCRYKLPLVLPDRLRKLVVGDSYNEPLVFPPTSALVDLELGNAYSRSLLLPHRLQSLTFGWKSRFNYPLTLPPSILCIKFGDSYNQSTVLPSGVEELRVGQAFSHGLSLPTSLRKIEWCCGLPIDIPEGVTEMTFGPTFQQSVVLPTTLKKASFGMDTYTHPVNLPTGLEKLTWKPACIVSLPLGLRELVVERGAPLALPEGLLKLTFGCASYTLPESVREVICYNGTFTHPTILQHVTLCYSCSRVDLSHHKINKLTIDNTGLEIEKWPQGLKEVEFTSVDAFPTMRVPKGCRIVGDKRPANVVME